MLKHSNIYIVLILYLINNFSLLLSNEQPIIVNSLNHDELLLHSPLRFTSTNINNFLTHTYNHPKYASEIIPHNTGHFMQLLEHGPKSKQNHEYMIAVLRLLRQKISAAGYMNATELERITTFAPTILIEYCNCESPFYHKKNSQKLKNLFLHIIENCIYKTLWDSSQPKIMSDQLIKIGNNLANLKTVGMIEDEDDLNDLIHSLIDRFIYVLELNDQPLPNNFYDDLTKQLTQASWMQLPEIESAINTKLKKIDLAFFKIKFKTQASSSLELL